MSHTNSKCKQGFYIHAPNIAAVIEPNQNERCTRQSTTVVNIEDDEDLETLTKAAEVDGFSYTMGEDLSGMGTPDAPLDGDLDGIRVTVRGKPQQNLTSSCDLKQEVLVNITHAQCVVRRMALINVNWNGTFFEPTMLQKIGLHMQLGHSIDAVCPFLSAGKLPASNLWKSLKIMMSNWTHSPPPDHYKVLLLGTGNPHQNLHSE
ncbi:hypothetical protein ARMGADRAFT_1037661 [Armillaria gallica]|uniref:Uncharacterized protein n=1 Tax=Armillaria gallica TaxID=47427 RepID=A0A2H3CKP0_ARMGA|nr:hypothetical protein ARMGADRAFT_1037661 [Armillaria gallica]